MNAAMSDPARDESDPRECGWMGCHHPRCERSCAAVSVDEWANWNASRPGLASEIRAIVRAAQKTVSGRLGLADQINALLVVGPSGCEHEWSQRGTEGDRWRECWLCGLQEDVA
jgi:hypothetical protein